MEELDLKQLLKIFWEKRIQIILIIALFIAIGIVYSFKIVTPMYQATTKLLLVTNSPSDIMEAGDISTTDVTLNSKLVLTYNELVKTNKIIKNVISNLGLDLSEEQIKSCLSVDEISNTELMVITVKNKDAELSAKIANETAKVFIQNVKELYGLENVRVVDEAEVPEQVSNINHTKNIAIFAFVGVIIAIVYVVIVNMFDTRIKNEEDIEETLDLPVLVALPNHEKNNRNSKVSELFKMLRTKIQYMNFSKEINSILITSTLDKEGKSWVAAELASVFAQAGKKVLLIDADMRNGKLCEKFGISHGPGLSNYLDEKNKKMVLNDYLKETEVANLYLMPAGDVATNPSELLMVSKMTTLLQELKQEFDLIIIDGTSCKLVADSLILSRLVDETIVVARNNYAQKDDVKKAVKDIKSVGGKITGVVYNQI